MTTQQGCLIHTNIEFCTPKHTTQYLWRFLLQTKAYHTAQSNIHFGHQGILHGKCKAFILHTKAYDHDRVEFRGYKTQAISDVCHLCVKFHIVCSFNKFEARTAQAVIPACCFCYSHKQYLSYWSCLCSVWRREQRSQHILHVRISISKLGPPKTADIKQPAWKAMD